MVRALPCCCKIIIKDNKITKLLSIYGAPSTSKLMFLLVEISYEAQEFLPHLRLGLFHFKCSHYVHYTKKYAVGGDAMTQV